VFTGIGMVTGPAVGGFLYAVSYLIIFYGSMLEIIVFIR
jgi:hypothetical protein